jgi:lipopolysaccharide transport system ATP-binding protein
MDNKLAIQVTGLSKAYRIGLKDKKHETLVGTILQAIKKPLQNFRNISNLKKFNSNGASDDIFWALQNVSFDIRKGEVVGVIGKNGAGKSTLLKLLSRITYPTAGRIETFGKVASLLEVGTGFNPDLTGRENVYLNGTILGLSKKEIDERFEEIVRFSGIEQFIETPVKRYSSGMKVRLAFAVAAHLEPDILIIDEVLAVGDAEFQRKCIGKMQEISEGGGRTVLFVSHNMAAVKALCTRGIVLKNGEKVFDGDQVAAINFYQSQLDDSGDLDFTDNMAEAPGNDVVKVIRFKVKPLTGDIISIASGISFDLELFINEVGSNLDITFELRNSEDVVVFHTGNYISTNDDSQKGFYNVKSFVPANILNAGLYFFSIIVGRDQKTALYKGRDLISFEVINEVEGKHMKLLPGVIRPSLEFTTTFAEKL